MLDSLERRVKIVATLGPSSNQPKVIKDLIVAGVNVFRLNFSHGDHEAHKSVFNTVREQAAELNSNVAIMQDLQGPKIRVGKIKSPGMKLLSGSEVSLAWGKVAEGSIPISEEIGEAFAANLVEGARLLFDDGRIRCRVRKVAKKKIDLSVIHGGTLTSNKGINVPGTTLPFDALTDKDREDLSFGLDLGVDAIALSFVSGEKDVLDVREIIKSHKSGNSPLVIAKIERQEAVHNQDAIIDVSDGLLVARGDMAVELGADQVPIIQKQLIQSCNELGVPIITATQMLESMVSSPTPTRAEASDVANAVFDGTDAVMLSGETASGEFPVRTVKTMDRIIRSAEKSSDRYAKNRRIQPMGGVVVESIEFSAAKVAHHVGAVGIVTITHTGNAARTLAKFRPDKPIYAIMDRAEALRKLAFVWGVQGALIDEIKATDDLFSMIEASIEKNEWAARGDWMVVTAGVPTLKRGTTNMIKVHRVGANESRTL